MIEDFARRWPAVATTGLIVNRQFARAHPQAVDDMIAACLSAHRTIGGDPARLAAVASTLLESDTDLLPAATQFVRADTWDVNGGMTPESVRDTRQFYVRAGSLPPDADPTAFVDRSFLDRVLQAIGRVTRGAANTMD